MSWVQWQDEIWPVTKNEAALHVHLWPPDAGCPRQGWSWNLFHCQLAPKKTRDGMECERWISVELMKLNFQETDWRRFSGLEIRADPAWHETHEVTNEYGTLGLSEARFSAVYLERFTDESGRRVVRRDQNCIAHDFVIRFGARDGFRFPCELDAWMIPREEYHRHEPETDADVGRFAAGPPNLRIMTPAHFVRGSVAVPRCGDDPLPLARRYLLEVISYDEELRDPRVSWAARHTADRKEIVPMPGFASTVNFSTPK